MEEKNIKETKENDLEMQEQEVQENQTIEDKSYQIVIEEARASLYKDYAKTKKISNIMMFAVVIAIAGIMFLITSNNMILQGIGYGLVALLVVGMVVYYILNRKKFPNKTKNYVNTVAGKMNSRMFGNSNFSDMVYDTDKKLEISELVGDGIYAEATKINSRNVVSGVYKGHPFTYAEAALIRTYDRKKPLPPLFVGRYVSMPNELKFDGRFVVVLKNVKEQFDSPNSISDLAILEDKDQYTIYGPDGSDYHEVLKDDFLNNLRKIQIKNHLLNINLAIWGGRFAVYLSYDDSIMSVPFEKPFDYDGFEEAANDLSAIFEVFAGE